jgi:hypothetical protein
MRLLSCDIPLSRCLIGQIKYRICSEDGPLFADLRASSDDGALRLMHPICADAWILSQP